MDDKVKKVKKLTITEAQIQQADADAELADKLLNGKEFKFFHNFLSSEKEQIIDSAVNNKLKEIVHKKETHDVIYTRREQEVEDAGRFKFIYKIINFLASVKNKPKEIEEAIKQGRLVKE